MGPGSPLADTLFPDLRVGASHPVNMLKTSKVTRLSSRSSRAASAHARAAVKRPVRTSRVTVGDVDLSGSPGDDASPRSAAPPPAKRQRRTELDSLVASLPLGVDLSSADRALRPSQAVAYAESPMTAASSDEDSSDHSWNSDPDSGADSSD